MCAPLLVKNSRISNVNGVLNAIIEGKPIGKSVLQGEGIPAHYFSISFRYLFSIKRKYKISFSLSFKKEKILLH